MNTITLVTVLDQMEMMDPDNKPRKFDIKFVTADMNRKTGGEIIEIKNARKCIGERNKEIIYGSGSRPSRKPDHYKNSTRNILCENGQIRKVHIRLIIEFNGKKVIY